MIRSRNCVQNSSWSCRVPVSSPSAMPWAAWRMFALQSLGLQTTLNFGATGEVPMRHSSTSSPKKLNELSVILLSQSSAARCSSVNRAAIHTIVTASSPAAYVISCPMWLWSVRSNWFSISTQARLAVSLQRMSRERARRSFPGLPAPTPGRAPRRAIRDSRLAPATA